MFETVVQVNEELKQTVFDGPFKKKLNLQAIDRKNVENSTENDS